MILSISGIWTVGNLAVGASATLTIDANVEPSGLRTNSAEVWSSDQIDADSTPGNASTTSDDDNQSVTVVPSGIADLSVINSVNNSAPKCGANVVFTIEVINDGPDDATNVQIEGCSACGFNLCIE